MPQPEQNPSARSDRTVGNDRSTRSDRRDGRDQYDRYKPLLVEHAEVPGDDPRRQHLRAQLMTGYLPVAQHIARRFLGRGQPIEDLEQVASIGLMRALERYDPARGHEFLAFAVPTITGEVRRYFRDATWTVCTPRSIKDRYVSVNAAIMRLSEDLDRAPTVSELAADLGLADVDVTEAIAATGSREPASLEQTDPASGRALGDVLGVEDSGLERAEVRAVLREAITCLSGRERAILARRFVYDHTQSQIAEALGLSQMHVSRLLTRILGQLREHLVVERESSRKDIA